MIRLVVGFGLLSCLSAAETAVPSAMVQSLELDAARPYFIPCHPRVTTTIRFPRAIGAPDGSVSAFTEDAGKTGTAEYLVTWQVGDPYFTVTPLRLGPMANLNVPYDGHTYVFFFYQAADPLQAVAAVNLEDGNTSAVTPTERGPDVVRTKTRPRSESVPATPARLLGFLDRLKLIHATPVGPALASVANAMGVEIAITKEESNPPTSPKVRASDSRLGEILVPVNDCGLYQVVLLRAVRDPRLNCVGFVCLVRNTSDQTLSFDVNSFGARAGAEYLAQRISDASPALKPGEQSPAYFVVQATHNSPLLAANAWRISVDLVAPRLNPGAMLGRSFGERP